LFLRHKMRVLQLAFTAIFAGILRVHSLSTSILENIPNLKCSQSSTHIFTVHDFALDINGSSLDLRKDEEEIMQYLVSPAPESLFVLQKSLNRLNCNDIADDASGLIHDLESLVTYLVKPAYTCVLLRNEMNEKERWKIKMIPKNNSIAPLTFIDGNRSESIDMKNMTLSEELYHFTSTKDLAKLALSTVTENPIQDALIIDKKLQNIERQTIKRLSLTLGTDLRGFSAADAAYCFALSGITNEAIYNALLSISYHELKRTCHRKSSFKQKDILHMIEKFGACNIHSCIQQKLYKLASDCLIEKAFDRNNPLIDDLRRDDYSRLLYMDRSRLWLFRHSIRQLKVKPDDFSKDHFQTEINWNDHFTDISKPLVVDVGCGLGVSILNLASANTHEHSLELNVDWSRCNFLGADLNLSLLRYPQGLLTRMNEDLKGRVCFLHQPATCLLKELQSYPGPTELIMIQYPSPYSLLESDSNIETQTWKKGNTQLSPKQSGGFMVSNELMTLASHLMNTNDRSRLLIQTKCEDVAIAIKNMAMDTGLFHPVPFQNYVHDIEYCYSTIAKRRPKRVNDWLDLNASQNIERAQGFIWSSSNVLPREGFSETEIHADFEKIVCHRLLLRSNK
jgi:hypothetical protein